jgi:hypothetical protein
VEVAPNARDAELEQLSHYSTEPSAKRLAKSHPDVAAKVYRALGMRILNAKKSKYYDAALGNFENAQRCYQRAGLVKKWNAVIAEVRASHPRKAGFMSDFERLVTGHGPSDEPSFLERARARWSPARRGCFAASPAARVRRPRGETPTKASVAIERTRRTRRTMWLAAAVPAALVCIFAVMNGEAIAAIVRGQPVKPTDTWSLWRLSPSTPQQTAATLRAEALAACSNQDFEGCEALLDEAAQMDPEGEHA